MHTDRNHLILLDSTHLRDTWSERYSLLQPSNYGCNHNSIIRYFQLLLFIILYPIICIAKLVISIKQRHRQYFNARTPLSTPIDCHTSPCGKYTAIVTPCSIRISSLHIQTSILLLNADITVQINSILKLSWTRDSKYLALLVSRPTPLLIITDCRANKVSQLELNQCYSDAPIDLTVMDCGVGVRQHRCVILTCSGELFWIDISSTGEFVGNPTKLDLRTFHSLSTNTLLYVHDMKLLIVGGAGYGPILEKNTNIFLRHGISIWTRIEQHPGFKQLTFPDANSVGLTIMPWQQHVMRLASSHGTLLSLHRDYSIAIWNMPSLTLHTLLTVDKPQSSHLVSCLFWSQREFIISHSTGHLEIINIDTGVNILDQQMNTQIHPTIFNSLSHRNESTISLSYNLAQLENSANKWTLVNKSCQFLYSFTGIERLQRQEVVFYSIECKLAQFSQVTPLQLYERRLINREYTEALYMAQLYHLNHDLLYRSQWEHSRKNKYDVTQYLTQIIDITYVLDQCLTCQTANLESTEEIIKLGFTLIEDSHLTSDMDDISANLSDEYLLSVKLKLRRRSEMFNCYSSTLNNDATIKFNIDAFNYMCTTPLMTLLSELAAEGRITELLGCVSYFWSLISSHLLSLLCLITETESPSSYKQLLPPTVHNTTTYSYNTNDSIIHLGEDEFYNAYPGLMQFRDVDINDLTILENWYKFRVHQIDNLSGQIDNAKLLIDHGVESGIPGLLLLQHDIWYLSVITHELEINSQLMSLAKVSKLNTEERINIVITDANKSNIVSIFELFVIPIVEFAEFHLSLDKLHLIENCLLSLSKQGLPLVQLIFQKCYSPECILIPHQYLIHLSHRCVLSCEVAQHLTAAIDISKLMSDKQEVEIGSESYDNAKKIEITSLLNAASILEVYSVVLSISEIAAYNNAKESDSQMLIRKLLSYVLQSEEFAPVNTFAKLWKDISTLKEIVFPKLTLSTCLTLFCEALLTSNFQDGINLARSFLSLIPEIVEPTANLLTFEDSHEVVLRAAQFYFNAANSIISEEMHLARTCLNLLQPPSLLVQKEYNLIAVLGILDDFHYDMLPTNIRLLEDKTKFVITLLESSPRMHRYYSKIEKLMHLLEVSNTPESNGVIPQCEVLVRTAEIALQDDDWCICEQLCYRIVQAKYHSGWEVCFKLASVKSFTNLASREVLIAFALSTCPNNHIELVLEGSYTLACQILDKATSKNIGQQVMDNVSKLMGKALNTLAYFTGHIKEESTPVDEVSCEQQFCIKNHPYYRTGCASNLYQLYSSQFQRPYMELYSYMTTIYELNITEMDANINNLLDQYNDCVNKAFSIAIQHDTTLSLSYLLSLPNYVTANNIIDSITPNRFIVELLVYYISLSIHYNPSESIKFVSLASSPVNCFKQLELYATNADRTSILVQNFISAIQTVQVYWESDYLHEISIDIDREFYRTDKNYQKAIIRKLSQNLDTFDFAIEVCAKHGISHVELRLELLLYTLVKSSYTNRDDIYALFEKKGILQSLSCNPLICYKCLVSRIYNLIPGTRYNNLIICTDLLIRCEKALNASIIPFRACRLSCYNLINLLALFQTNLPGLDFHTYANSTDPLSILEPFLSVDIIKALSSCVYLNPSHNYDGVITIEHLHLAYSCKLVYQIDVSNDNEEFNMPQYGMNRGLIESMDKLTEFYLIKLFDRVLFSHRSLILTLSQRQYYFHYLCISINQLQSNDIKRSIQPIIIQLSKHVDACFSPILDSLSTPTATAKPQVYYADEFYLSKCEPSVISNILTRMLSDLHSLTIINALLTLANNVKGQTFNLNDAIQHEIYTIANGLQFEYISVTKFGAPLCKIESLSSYIHLDKLYFIFSDDTTHINKQFFYDKMLMELLKDMLKSSDYHSNIKSAICIIFQSSIASSEDAIIITQLSIEAYINQHWTCKFDAFDINNTSDQFSLINKLILLSDTDIHYDALCKIIHLFPTSEEISLCKLLEAVFEAWTTSALPGIELILYNRLLVHFSEEQDDRFILNLEAYNLIYSTLYSLITPYPLHYNDALQKLTAIPELQNTSDQFLHALYELAILRNLTPKLVKTPIWTLFIDYLQTHSTIPLTHIGIALNEKLQIFSNDNDAASVIAKQLLTSGYTMSSDLV